MEELLKLAADMSKNQALNQHKAHTGKRSRDSLLMLQPVKQTVQAGENREKGGGHAL
jgi:hypothetical protein